jgi:uncharacterized protein with FMN-binding domain
MTTLRKIGNSLGLALIGAAAISLSSCKFADDINALQVNDVSISSVKDGTYEGAQYNEPVTAKVNVAVKDGKIASIKLLEHGHGPGHGADAIVDRVVAAQSLKVDSVSGATYSSKVVIKAIELALDKGL